MTIASADNSGSPYSSTSRKPSLSWRARYSRAALSPSRSIFGRRRFMGDLRPRTCRRISSTANIICQQSYSTVPGVPFDSRATTRRSAARSIPSYFPFVFRAMERTFSTSSQEAMYSSARFSSNTVTASISGSSSGAAASLPHRAAAPCPLRTPGNSPRTIRLGCRLRTRGCALPVGRGRSGRG